MEIRELQDLQELLEFGFLLKVDTSGYYIVQKDFNGRSVTIPISEDLYLFYVEERAISKKLSNWDKNHRDNEELETLLLIHDYERSYEQSSKDLHTRELLEQVSIALESSTAKERKRFILKFVHGYSYAEIARSENKSEATVKESVYKVLRKMNNILKL